MNLTGKDIARRIREHNKIHQRKEPLNSEIITEILEVAAVLFEKIDAGEYQAVKHGHWITQGDTAYCSICGRSCRTQFNGVEPIPCETPYCDNCGTRMDGGEVE